VLRNSPLLLIKFDDSRKYTSNTPNTPTLNYYPTNPPFLHHHPKKKKKKIQIPYVPVPLVPYISLLFSSG
jgi:hypothetical protein